MPEYSTASGNMESMAPPNAAIAAPPKPANADKLQQILAHILLKIPDYATDSQQHEGWLSRANKAGNLLATGDASAAAVLLDALGSEMAHVFNSRRKDPAGILDRLSRGWRNACDESLRELEALQQRYMALIESSRHNIPAVIEHVLAQWREIAKQLRGVDALIEDACATALRSLRAGKPVVLRQAVKHAKAAITSSAFLTSVDDNGVMDTSIVERLSAQLERLLKFEETKS